MSTFGRAVTIGLTIGLVLVLLPAVASAGSDIATFESFYRKSWSMSPWDWALAAVAALGAVVAVVYLAPAAGPVVTGIGSWIGGLFGYSGIAATNFGLALLGGGAVASGGFGVAGGTALLTAAFTFGTDIVIDYAASTASQSFEYEKFAAASRQMVTLPLPINTRGPESYRDAVKALESINSNELLSSEANRAIIGSVISDLQRYPIAQLDADDRARHQSMLGLLCFIVDDYRCAREYARAGIFSAREANILATMPAFLLSTTLLYDKVVKFNYSVDLLKYAVQEEPENPLVPLLFAIYLDRMTFRINDGTLTVRDLDSVAGVGATEDLRDSWGAVQVVLLSRYVMQIKLAQQRIESLAKSSNKTIRSNPTTLAVVTASLNDYEHLLDRANYIAGGLAAPGAIDKSDLPTELGQARGLLDQYGGDRDRLRQLIVGLKKYQESLVTEPTAESGYKPLPWRVALILALAAFGVGYLVGRRRERGGKL